MYSRSRERRKEAERENGRVFNGVAHWTSRDFPVHAAWSGLGLLAGRWGLRGRRRPAGSQTRACSKWCRIAWTCASLCTAFRRWSAPPSNGKALLSPRGIYGRCRRPVSHTYWETVAAKVEDDPWAMDLVINGRCVRPALGRRWCHHRWSLNQGLGLDPEYFGMDGGDRWIPDGEQGFNRSHIKSGASILDPRACVPYRFI
jgi:hypothetical protein